MTWRPKLTSTNKNSAYDPFPALIYTPKPNVNRQNSQTLENLHVNKNAGEHFEKWPHLQKDWGSRDEEEEKGKRKNILFYIKK